MLDLDFCWVDAGVDDWTWMDGIFWMGSLHLDACFGRNGIGFGTAPHLGWLDNDHEITFDYESDDHDMDDL